MNAGTPTKRGPVTWLVALWLVLGLAGCATTPKIDWTARIGTYTHDQAVMDLGPPDKSARLSDGSIVADWMTRRAQTVVAPEPYYLSPGCYFGPLTPTYTESYFPARYLRLTFDADGKLKAWKETGE